MTSIKPTSVPSKTLAQSINGSATTFEVSDILGWDGVALTSSDFGTVAYGMFHNSAKTAVEIFEFDPATIASSAIDFVRRGLKFDGDLTTEVSGNKLTWVKGDTRVLLGTDVPQLFKNYVDIHAAQTIGGAKTFSVVPKTTGGDPVDDNDLTRKAYVNTLVLGTLTTINVIVPGTAGETIAAGNLVYFDDTQNKWYKTDADTAATVQNVLLAIAQGSGTASNPIAGGVMLQGVDANQSGLTNGQTYYASNTAGGVSSSAGTTEVTVGIGKSATELYFNPRFDQMITEDQQDALTGTSGTPSASNKFVTEADASATSAASKLVRALASGKIDPSFIQNLGNSFVAGESLVPGDPVYASGYPANAPTYDTHNSFYTVSSSSFSNSFTVGNNSNRLLFVVVSIQNTHTISSVTYNGVAITSLVSNGGGDGTFLYTIGYILAPATGANNLVVTTSGAVTIGVNAYSFYNIEQQAPEVSVSTSGSSSASITATSTPLTTRALIMSAIVSRQAATVGGTAWLNNVSTNTLGFKTAHSGEVVPIASKTVTATADSSGFSTFVWSYTFAAISASQSTRVYKTSATQSQTCKAFVGLSQDTVSAGSNVQVSDVGTDSNRTGMTPGKIQYLSETTGQLTATAPSNVVRVGFAKSSTEIALSKQIENDLI